MTLECVYGPTNPDSTGMESVDFWYKSVGLPTQQILAVSQVHPLARLGDTPRTTCPATWEDAQKEREASVTLARQKMDPKLLAPEPIPFDRVMKASDYALYRSALVGMDDYNQFHDPSRLKQAEAAKASLMAYYTQTCARLTQTNGNSRVLTCGVRDQLQDSLSDIPDVPDSGSGRQDQPRVAAAQYAIAVTIIDPIDMAGVQAGHFFRASLDKPMGDATHVVAPAGTEIFLKGTENTRNQNPGMVHIDLVVDHATINGKQIKLTSNSMPRTVRTDTVLMSRGQQIPVPLRDRQVTPGIKMHFWAQVAGPT